MIRFLTENNQSLLNQVRATDIGALSGLQSATGKKQIDEGYLSTDDREMLAYQAGLSNQIQFGDVEFDDDDMVNLRSGL